MQVQQQHKPPTVLLNAHASARATTAATSFARWCKQCVSPWLQRPAQGFYMSYTAKEPPPRGGIWSPSLQGTQMCFYSSNLSGRRQVASHDQQQTANSNPRPELLTVFGPCYQLEHSPEAQNVEHTDEQHMQQPVRASVFTHSSYLCCRIGLM